jgi:hypothetical protein
MKAYWTLYWKEMKSIWELAVFLFFAFVLSSLGIVMIEFIQSYHQYANHFVKHSQSPLFQSLYDNLSLFISAIPYMFLIIFIYMLIIEKKTNKHLLMFSLSPRKYSNVLSKFLVIMTLLLIFILLQEIHKIHWLITSPIEDCFNAHYNSYFSQYFHERFPDFIDAVTKERIYNTLILIPTNRISNNMINLISHHTGWGDFARIYSLFFAFSCIICFVQGVVTSIKRYQLVVGIIALIVMYEIFIIMFHYFVQWPIHEYFSWDRYISTIITDRFYGTSLYPFIFGFISLISGLFLYEKFEEI